MATRVAPRKRCFRRYPRAIADAADRWLEHVSPPRGGPKERANRHRPVPPRHTSTGVQASRSGRAACCEEAALLSCGAACAPWTPRTSGIRTSRNRSTTWQVTRPRRPTTPHPGRQSNVRPTAAGVVAIRHSAQVGAARHHHTGVPVHDTAAGHAAAPRGQATPGDHGGEGSRDSNSQSVRRRQRRTRQTGDIRARIHVFQFAGCRTRTICASSCRRAGRSRSHCRRRSDEWRWRAARRRRELRRHGCWLCIATAAARLSVNVTLRFDEADQRCRVKQCRWPRSWARSRRWSRDVWSCHSARRCCDGCSAAGRATVGRGRGWRRCSQPASSHSRDSWTSHCPISDHVGDRCWRWRWRCASRRRRLHR